MMDRRILVFFASVAVLMGAAGYLLAQNRTPSTDVSATPVTLLPPLQESTPTTEAPASEPTVRSTLPPTPTAEIFQYAADGGCTPGGNRLPDGTYYGSVVVNEDRSLAFNLKCLFLAEDLPPDFDELFASRFPGEAFPATGFDLIDAASADRRVRFAWNSEMTLDGGLYVGDDAYLGFLARDEVPFDATIQIEEGIATTVVEILPGVSPG
jgi:hypothetical protein